MDSIPLAEQLPVCTVGEEFPAAQVQGDFRGGHLRFAEGTKERNRLFELEKLEMASWRKFPLDATESFNFRSHG